MSKLTASKVVLPNISSSISLSYAQRYQHMTKLANYNEMNQAQIWKEYQKLRACLKEINEEVLYHMERKAYTNINKQKTNKPMNNDSEGTLILLEDQKRSNELRYSNFYNELTKLEQRVTYLASKNGYLQQMVLQTEDLQARIKKTNTEIKDHKRKANIIGKNIVNCTSALDKLILQQQRLNRANIRYRRFKQYFDSISNKQQMYKERISQAQDAIDGRIKQFSTQQNFIQQQIHFERYEQLKKIKENLTKYEPVYKRNYLMKLKDLQILVNSVTKHDKVIQQNEGNIMNLRTQIQMVSSLIGKTNYKKRSSSSMLQMSMNQGRLRSKQNTSRQSIQVDLHNKKQKQQHQRNRVLSSMNDKNQGAHINNHNQK